MSNLNKTTNTLLTIAFIIEFGATIALAMVVKRYFGEAWCEFVLVLAYALTLLESSFLIRPTVKNEVKEMFDKHGIEYSNDEETPPEA